MTKADERLDDRGRTKLLGLLDAGDPTGEVRTAWHAKKSSTPSNDHLDPGLALQFVTWLGHGLQDQSCPPEVGQLGRTIARWRHQICAWQLAHVSNGPTEAADNLIESVTRVAFGFSKSRNCRVRALLCAGRPQLDPARHDHTNFPVKSEAPLWIGTARQNRNSAGPRGRRCLVFSR